MPEWVWVVLVVAAAVALNVAVLRRHRQPASEPCQFCGSVDRESCTAECASWVGE